MNLFLVKLSWSSARPSTCTHSQRDGIAGVCLVREEKWVEIRSCDPPVCLRLYHSSPTAVILFKQRQMASGKVGKSPSPSLSLTPLSIYYINISASFCCSLLSLQIQDFCRIKFRSFFHHYTPLFHHSTGEFVGLLYSIKQKYSTCLCASERKVRKKLSLSK